MAEEEKHGDHWNVIGIELLGALGCDWGPWLLGFEQRSLVSFKFQFLVNLW